MPLTSKGRQALKARAHALKPVVLLGNQGLSPAVIKEIDIALRDHELIKVRIPTNDRDLRKEVVEAICKEVSAESVQLIGNICVLYRRSEEKSEK